MLFYIPAICRQPTTAHRSMQEKPASKCQSVSRPIAPLHPEKRSANGRSANRRSPQSEQQARLGQSTLELHQLAFDATFQPENVIKQRLILHINLSTKMGKRTAKAGIVGKYGPRYSSTLRRIVKKFEISQRLAYECPFCGKVTEFEQNTLKRTAAGIWGCSACFRTVAGGAWIPRYAPRDSVLTSPRPPAPL